MAGRLGHQDPHTLGEGGRRRLRLRGPLLAADGVGTRFDVRNLRTSLQLTRTLLTVSSLTPNSSACRRFDFPSGSLVVDEKRHDCADEDNGEPSEDPRQSLEAAA